ncbi:cytochrome C [Sphingomonas sp. Leaf231]|uniref:c-type cytochrome n=1 Tax=Sphingomonas sp. Leaf231 TaxID=1736301 RepID=UPI0006F800C9|nr:c-type cytochrome [Sphingomonas sp. Leaf231]KQN92794.1 cytochrome C [Sphingomonas sp. Leaf231]
MKLIAGLIAAPIVATMALAVSAPAPAQQNGQQAFAACKACHTVNKGGRNGIGPNLSGLFTRPPASAPGFNYSPAMKKAQLKWDDKTLNEYLAAPQKKVPGTRMPIATPDAAKRAAIIAYLKSETAK